MKITILSHDLSSNASMRAHRLAQAAAMFADVKMIGPVDEEGTWPALPHEPWIRTVPKLHFPEFLASFFELVEAADGDLLIAVKPHLASFGVALLSAEKRGIPLILDIDDLDLALAPPSEWAQNPSMMELSRPGSAIYLSLLTKAIGAASAITVSSNALQERFGGTRILHGCDTTLFDPALFDRIQAREIFGFKAPTVLFPGAVRPHKGMRCLAEAVRRVPGVRLAVTCREHDLSGAEWNEFPIDRISFLPYSSLPPLFAAADIVVVPQSASEPALYQTPMKVFEAMAMAKPIIAGSVGDLPEILDQCGKAVATENVDQLAEAIHQFVSDSQTANSLGKKARERCVKEYSVSSTAGRLRDIISRFTTCPPVIPSNNTKPIVVPVTGFTASALCDLGMPLLPRALDAQEVQYQFETIIREPLRLEFITVLRHKPAKRCLIEYGFDIDGRKITWIGKARRRKEILQSHRLLEKLWRAGFSDESLDGISIPEPVALIPEFRMSLQRKVAGTLASELLETAQGLAVAARVAEALSKLHRSGVPSHRKHTIKDELGILENRLNRVINSEPHLKHRIIRILDGCYDLAVTIPEVTVQGIHRDFYPNQVLLNDSRVYLLDLDLYAEGDPALDAGNFIAHIIEQSLRKFGYAEALADTAEAFEEKFLELSDKSQPYSVQAYTTLTLARHIYLCGQFPERRKSREALLDLCDQRLLKIEQCNKE